MCQDAPEFTTKFGGSARFARGRPLENRDDGRDGLRPLLDDGVEAGGGAGADGSLPPPSGGPPRGVRAPAARPARGGGRGGAGALPAILDPPHPPPQPLAP